MNRKVPGWLARAVKEGRVTSVKDHLKLLPQKRISNACRAECLRPVLEKMGIAKHFVREFAWMELRKGHPRRFDWCWAEAKLAIEIDGAVHRIKAQAERDRHRNNAALLLGWRLLHFSPGYVNRNGEEVAKTIRAAMQL